MQGFESVEHELEARRKELEQQLATVRGHMSEIEADLERVHDAMAALTGAKKKSKSKARAKKPVTTVADVQQHIAHVRQENPFADAGTLEKAVRARVQQHGGSLSGFKRTFAEALLTSPGHHGSSSTPAHESHGQSHGSSHAQPHRGLALGDPFAHRE